MQASKVEDFRRMFPGYIEVNNEAYSLKVKQEHTPHDPFGKRIHVTASPRFNTGISAQYSLTDEILYEQSTNIHALVGNIIQELTAKLIEQSHKPMFEL